MWQLVAKPQACGASRSHRCAPSKSLPRTRHGVSRLSKRHSGEQCSTPPPHHAAERRLSLKGKPLGEQGSILCGLTRVGDRTLQVSRHESLEKPDNRTNYCRGAALLQWFWSLTAPIGFPVVTTPRQEFTGVTGGRLTLLPAVQFSHRSKVGESPDTFHGQPPRPFHTSQPSGVFPSQCKVAAIYGHD